MGWFLENSAVFLQNNINAEFGKALVIAAECGHYNIAQTLINYHFAHKIIINELDILSAYGRALACKKHRLSRLLKRLIDYKA